MKLAKVYHWLREVALCLCSTSCQGFAIETEWHEMKMPKVANWNTITFTKPKMLGHHQANANMHPTISHTIPHSVRKTINLHTRICDLEIENGACRWKTIETHIVKRVRMRSISHYDVKHSKALDNAAKHQLSHALTPNTMLITTCSWTLDYIECLGVCGMK